jgi:transposase-like protein
MKLIDVQKAFATDEQCLEYLERSRWPKGVRCVTCGNAKISVITRQSKTKNKRAKLYQCLEPTCKQQFSATTGTIFHDSHLPLSKWFTAIALLVDAKKGMSALQLQRHLGVNYRTAWYLAHRIREAMTEGDTTKLKGVVEVDETYIGGRQWGRKNKLKNKDIVVGIRQRGGPLRFIQVENTTAETLYNVISQHVDKDVEMIVTDELPAYNFNLTKYQGKHKRIKHKDHVYVRGEVHTNTIESAFSLFKRGIIGPFHRVSIKHLQRYLNEFQYRFNRREKPDRFEETVNRLAIGKALPYAKLTEENAFTPFVRQ